MSKVAIVILNYNGKNWLEKMLPSVVNHSTNPNYEIIIADNASTDDSLEFLSKNYPAVKTIVLAENTGYAGGYNNALKQIDSEYYVLLNSDIEVTQGWIEAVVSRMDANPKIGACQPKIRSWHEREKFEYAGASGGLIDFLGYPFCRGRIFDSLEADNGQYDEPQEVFWATGACLFVRSKAYWELNGLDADFFAHMEEIDLCWRMQNGGYQVWVEPSSIVYHVGGGTLHKSNPRKTFLNFRNNLSMLFKNLPSAALIPVLFLRLVLDGLAALRFLFKGEFSNILAIFKGHFAFYFSIPRLWKKRKAQPKKKSLKELKGLTNLSLIWHYYIKGNKKFTDLPL